VRQEKSLYNTVKSMNINNLHEIFSWI